MKKKILITQRVEEVSSYKETRDCLDVRWTNLLEDIGCLPVLMPSYLNSPINYLNSISFDGVILSGGNDLSHIPNPSRPSIQRDNTESEILKFATENSLPVLGVCRGMQMINHYCGGSQINVDTSIHVSRRHSVKSIPTTLTQKHIGLKILQDYENVNSYHGYGIGSDNLSADLIPVLKAEDDSVEAFVHKIKNWIGIMWHPERESPFQPLDLKLLSGLYKL